jgi:hypothetical protein
MPISGDDMLYPARGGLGVPAQPLGAVAGFCCAVMLCGCGTPSADQVSAEEWRNAQVRIFAETTAEKLDAAIRDVFNRSRPGEYVFESAPGSLVARRTSTVFNADILQFTEIWSLRYAQTPEGLRAEIALSSSRAGPLAAQANATPPNPSAYDLFWRRTEFSLGRRNHWWTCTEFYDLSPYRNFSYGLCGQDYL